MEFDGLARSEFPLFVDYHGYPTTNTFYIESTDNPTRDIGFKMVKIWTSNFSSGLFIFSHKLPTTKNLLGVPKHLVIQSFPCFDRIFKHVELE
jgi:hypothetical protein